MFLCPVAGLQETGLRDTVCVRKSVCIWWVRGDLAQSLGGWLCYPVAASIGLSPLNLLL